MNVLLKLKLEKFGFEDENNKMILKNFRGRTIAVVDDSGYSITNNIDKDFREDIEKTLKKLDINPSGIKIKEKEFDPEVLLANGFYFDKGDTNYYCKDFKDHTVCIDKKYNVHFYTSDLKKFNQDITGRQERWKVRFRKLGITVNQFVEVEEYE